MWWWAFICLSDYLCTHNSVSYERIWWNFHYVKWQTAGIVLLSGQKISIFAPQGRLVAPIHVKFGMVKRHVGLLGLAKFHANLWTGVRTRPPKVKKFHFLVKSRPTGANPLTNFYSCQGLLYAQLLCISVLNLMCFASLITELLLRNRASVIYPEFSLHPVGKTMLWIEKWFNLF